MTITARDARKIDFDKFFYPGDDLGVNYTRKWTEVKIWAPVAEGVDFLLFSTEDQKKPDYEKKLTPAGKGVWQTELNGDWEGYYYLFRLHYGDLTEETVDPRARAVGTDSRKGLIVDLSKTDPPGWEDDERIKIDSPLEAVIYEVHVRDFSSSPHSGIQHQGQYLGFTEQGTTNEGGHSTGLSHLCELGITHVHLLPVFDFATVPDQSEDYNWGYDPYYYNVPEGSYATEPSDDSRIRELKQLVKALHDRGIGVIMDVVYNHTYHSEESPFQKTAPNYFYRFYEGDFADGSGCGNEIATERPMVRKFIVDSVKYWAEEYHIDGFRFDLMALIDKKTMSQVENTLHQIDPSILIYGEPWAALPPQLPYEEQVTKGTQRGMNLALFNDDFRDAIKGDLGGSYSGFIAGEEEQIEEIKSGVVGAVKYSEQISNFTDSPRESINYVSCHDNLTLWDKISVTYPDLDEREQIRLDRLAQAIVFTSQGVPFIQGGEEFLRTKYGHDNTYQAGDYYNQLKWERKSKYRETTDYYAGLIELHKKHPAFQLATQKQVREQLSFFSTPGCSLGFIIQCPESKGDREEIIVIYNAGRENIKVELPGPRRLGLLVDDRRAGCEVFSEFRASSVGLPRISPLVMKARSVD